MRESSRVESRELLARQSHLSILTLLTTQHLGPARQGARHPEHELSHLNASEI